MKKTNSQLQNEVDQLKKEQETLNNEIKYLHSKLNQAPISALDECKKGAPELMEHASRNEIGVIIFINNGKTVKYHSSATVGVAIDMFRSIIAARPNVRAAMECAVAIVDEVK